MDDALVAIHSELRWLVIAVLTLAGTYGFVQAPGHRPFDHRPFLIGAIVIDIQVAIGLAVYFLNDGWTQERLIPVVHPIGMLVALGVVHASLGRARRRAADGRGSGDLTAARDAYRSVGVGYFFALIVVALVIPWYRFT